jgi:hypothetical protein
MAVLITAEISKERAPDYSSATYDGVLNLVKDPLKQAPGLVAHVAHQTDEGWRIVEIWQSKAESDRFFAQHVAPHLPAGVHPKRRVQELHSLVTP